MTPNFDPTLPFVLLDDARAGTARLFTELTAVVQAEAPTRVVPALAALRDLGGERAGFIGFEAGYALEPRLAPLFRMPDDGLPLLWFGRFNQVRHLDEGAIDALLDAGPAELTVAIPAVERADYDTMIARIAALIEAGDIYQANATFAASVETHGHPLALYRRLRKAQAASYCALIYTGQRWILSLSPELFFKLEAGRITTRPMKGTAPRGVTATADDAAAAALAADPKNRTENLMIVDLLRNDLSRVAVPGSVATPALFEVERYPTVLQMTSTVTADVRTGIDAVGVLMALFPCGSVTGAPKLRAMEVIADVEAKPRGLYTGSIGWLGKDGDATLNVAIRTLVMQKSGGARMGLGSGIVADSGKASEWDECIGKAAFLTRRVGPIDLIETMRCDQDVIAHRQRHLDRLMASAIFLGHRLDRGEVEAAIELQRLRLAGGTGRIRLLVSASGAIAVQISPLPAAPTEPAVVALAPLPVDATDWRLSHKTSDRAFYDDARRIAGTFEVVFVRPDGRITEGSFTSVFVERNGLLLTPPLADGLLPGILRAALLTERRAVEAPLTVADLENGFLIGNALRGLLRAKISL